MVRKGNFPRVKKGKKQGERVKTDDKAIKGDDVKTDANNKQFEPKAKVEDLKLEGGAAKEILTSKGSDLSGQGGSGEPDFAGLIFLCNTSTKQDCFKYRVFGLPDAKKHLVEQIRQGMRLFLFDIDLRLLYGIYRASSRGGFNLEADAFRGSQKAFPWQVRFIVYTDCLPLAENVFKTAIKENYDEKKRFKVELSRDQVQKLVKLFRPVPPGDSVAGRDFPRDAGAGRDFPKDAGAGRKFPSRTAPFSHDEAPPKIKYEPKFPGLERQPQGRMVNKTHFDAYGADDVRSAREARLRQEIPILDMVNANSGPQDYAHTSGPLSFYSADPIRSELELGRTDPYKLGARSELELGRTDPYKLGARSDLELGRTDPYKLGARSELELGRTDPYKLGARSELELGRTDPYNLGARSELDFSRTDPYKLGARDDLYSAYPHGHTLGDPSVDADPLYRQRLQQMPDVSIEALDRRVGRSDPYKLGGRDDLYSAYQGHTLGNPSVEPDYLYRQRLQQVPDVSVEPLDRRLYGIDPLADGSSSYTGISSDLLQRRPSGLDDRGLMLPPKRHLLQEDLLPGKFEYHSGLPYEDSAVIPGRSLLSGMSRSYSGVDPRSYNQYF